MSQYIQAAFDGNGPEARIIPVREIRPANPEGESLLPGEQLVSEEGIDNLFVVKVLTSPEAYEEIKDVRREDIVLRIW